MVKKIHFVENLLDHFTKSFSSRVFDGHKENISVRCVSNMI